MIHESLWKQPLVKKYRERPKPEIEAVQLTLENRFEVAKWISAGTGVFAFALMDTSMGPGILAVDLEYGGRSWLDAGNWIAKGEGRLSFFWDTEAFERNYEPVDG